MEKKKAYGSPELEKLELEDEDLDNVSGGTGEEAPEPEPRVIDPAEEGFGEVGRGRRRGGGCDGVPYHRNARTFSSGRNSSC